MGMFQESLQWIFRKGGVLTIGILSVLLYKKLKLPDLMGAVAYGITAVGACGFVTHYVTDSGGAVADFKDEELFRELENLQTILERKKMAQEELKATCTRTKRLKNLLTSWNRDITSVEDRMALMELLQKSRSKRHLQAGSSTCATEVYEQSDDLTESYSNFPGDIVEDDNVHEVRNVKGDIEKLTDMNVAEHKKRKVEKYFDECSEKSHRNLKKFVDEGEEIPVGTVSKPCGDVMGFPNEELLKFSREGALKFPLEEISTSSDDNTSKHHGHFLESRDEKTEKFPKEKAESQFKDEMEGFSVKNQYVEGLESQLVEDVGKRYKKATEEDDESIDQSTVKSHSENVLEEHEASLHVEKIEEKHENETRENLKKQIEEDSTSSFEEERERQEEREIESQVVGEQYEENLETQSLKIVQMQWKGNVEKQREVEVEEKMGKHHEKETGGKMEMQLEKESKKRVEQQQMKEEEEKMEKEQVHEEVEKLKRQPGEEAKEKYEIEHVKEEMEKMEKQHEKEAKEDVVIRQEKEAKAKMEKQHKKGAKRKTSQKNMEMQCEKDAKEKMEMQDEKETEEKMGNQPEKEMKHLPDIASPPAKVQKCHEKEMESQLEENKEECDVTAEPSMDIAQH